MTINVFETDELGKGLVKNPATNLLDVNIDEETLQFVGNKNKLSIKQTATNKYTMLMNATNAKVKKNQCEQRTYLMTFGNFGILHLDFRTTANPQKFDVLGNFPDDAPLPTHLVEAQTYDGGSVFIGQGERIQNGEEIKWAGDGYIISGTQLQPNKRYILNLMGFFKKP